MCYFYRWRFGALVLDKTWLHLAVKYILRRTPHSAGSLSTSFVYLMFTIDFKKSIGKGKNLANCETEQKL